MNSHPVSVCSAGFRQAMRTLSQLLLFLVTLLFSGWQAALHAYPLEETPPAPSSFLLVARQEMPDPRFHKTVLLVTMHGNTGHIGVIINRPQGITLDRIFPDHPGAKEFTLFYGGPVYPGQVSYLVRGGAAVAGSLTISKSTYLAYDVPILGELLSGKRRYRDLRVMHGVASWAPGQLENEIRLGGWFILPLDEAAIFDHTPAGLWQEMYNRANRISL